MPAIITKGAFSAQGYGFGASAATGATYIEDVFSTYLYTGTGATQTITNGIDVSTKGGLVWMKGRSGATSNALYDTARGATYDIGSNLQNAQTTESTGLTAFGTTGFTIGALAKLNTSAATYVSWTFRKQPKFFDVVTYTGTGSATTIAHNLGSAPGMIIVKRTDATANWAVYHNSLTSASYYVTLNTTDAQTSDTTVWNATAPTSSVFSVGTSTLTNANAGTYVAYLFAHNAGGFGAAGTDNVISCGSYSSTAAINLGWEPQFILRKRINITGNWFNMDIMRGLTATLTSYNSLKPNTAAAETQDISCYLNVNATGFQDTNADAGATYIYMAIRRGPMKTPTDATKVYATQTWGGGGTAPPTFIAGFPVDFGFYRRTTTADAWYDNDRLRGLEYLLFTSTAAAAADTSAKFDYQNGYYSISGADSTYRSWMFRRAPGFFDEVCYTGTGDNQSVTHNLGVVPQLIIVKRRNGFSSWFTYNATSGVGKYLMVNDPSAVTTLAAFMSSVTSAAFVPSTNNIQIALSDSGGTYVAYLFATCPGVSKVGSYTGTGAAQNIDCGFAASARFILIKRTDSTGDWYVYDSARGISASNDPYLLLNSMVAEVTNTDYVGTYASGFALTSTAPAALNANGGSYIFLAVA